MSALGPAPSLVEAAVLAVSESPAPRPVTWLNYKGHVEVSLGHIMGPNRNRESLCVVAVEHGTNDQGEPTSRVGLSYMQWPARTVPLAQRWQAQAAVYMRIAEVAGGDPDSVTPVPPFAL